MIRRARSLNDGTRSREQQSVPASESPGGEERRDPIRVINLAVALPSGQRLISGVSFAVSEGEVVGIVGESGSGKTTTVSAIVGALRAPAFISAGEVRLFGEDLASLSTGRLRDVRAKALGFVISNPQSSLNPLARVGDQVADRLCIAFGLDRKSARERAIELLAAVGIPDARARARAYPHEFSGGMAQRVVIARALAPDPQLIIADEPTSGLDVTIQRQILDLLASHVHARGMSMALVTHDLGVVANYCDRVVVMFQGQVVENSLAATFFSSPAHPYSRRLLNASRGDTSGEWESLLDTPILEAN